MIQIIVYFFAIVGVFGMFAHCVDILIFFSEFWEGLKGVFRDLGDFISKDSKTNRKDCNLSKLKFDSPPRPTTKFENDLKENRRRPLEFDRNKNPSTMPKIDQSKVIIIGSLMIREDKSEPEPRKGNY